MILIVIPVINEKLNLKILIPNIQENMREDFRLLIIDGGSTDGLAGYLSPYISSGLAHYFAQKNTGLGAALNLGLAEGLKLNPNKIITMDGDLSHDPMDLEALILNCPDGGASIGSRYIKGGLFIGSFYRRWLSKIGNMIISYLLNMGISEATNGFRCYDSRVLETINKEYRDTFDHYNFQFQILHRIKQLKRPIKEVPIIFHERYKGRTKFSSHQIVFSIIGIFRLRYEKVKKYTNAL